MVIISETNFSIYNFKLTHFRKIVLARSSVSSNKTQPGRLRLSAILAVSRVMLEFS